MVNEDGNMDEGEENVYNDEAREDLVDNDELSPEEEAFMKGYDEASEPDELDDASDEDESKEKEED